METTVVPHEVEESFISGVKMFAGDVAGKVYISSKTSEVPKHLKKVENINDTLEIAREIFDPSNIHTVGNRIYIRFPEIEIMNSRNEKHKIYDLIVKLTITFGGYTNIEFEGLRLTLTPEEINSGYSHSHLERSSFGKYSHFCLSTSDFSILISNISVSSTVTNWELFFMSIEKFISWESLEGGPYVSLSTITQVNPTHDQTRIVDDINNNLIKKIPIECIDFHQFSIIPGYYFDDFLNNNAKVRSSEVREYTKVDIDEAYKKLTERGSKMKWNNDSILDFRVLVEDKKDKIEQEISVKDNIKNYYINYLNIELRQFSKKYKHEYNKKRKPRPYFTLSKAKAGNIRENTKSDRLPS